MADEEVCVVLSENDVSKWDDKTGERYHFPKQYQKSLRPGMRFVYYKGRLKPENKQYSSQRLSSEPHYFGIGRISEIKPDEAGHLYAVLTDFQQFEQAVLAKNAGAYYEEIPEQQKSNYWRFSVRPISADVFADIAVAAALTEPRHIISDIKNEAVHVENEADEESLVSYQEGKKSSKFVTIYERDQRLKNSLKVITALLAMPVALISRISTESMQKTLSIFITWCRFRSLANQKQWIIKRNSFPFVLTAMGSFIVKKTARFQLMN